MANKSRKSQSLLNGALILSLSTIVVKIIGVIYKIPLTNMIGTVGRGYFDSAYSLYVPIYTISMAGLPVAVSKMVSEQMALGHYRDVKMIHKVSRRLFLMMGIAGSLLMFLLAYPYALSVHNKAVLPAVLVIAPAIFFCCIMSIYRGYYNGLRNMTPTALSQVFEALGKMVFGLICAKYAISHGYERFEAGLTVYGKTVANETEALSAIYPYAAAAATAGVMLGTVVGMIFLLLLNRIKGDQITKTELVTAPKPASSSQISARLIRFSIPVIVTSLVFSITNLIDAITVQNRLAHVISNNLTYIRELYAEPLKGILDTDVKSFLYGAYALPLDFRNLIPAITMTLGISAIPTLSAAWAIRDKKQTRTSIESVMRVTMLIAMPCGVGLAVLAQPILAMLYGSGDAASSIPIAAPVMKAYGYTIFLMALSQPMTNMLQALDKTHIPLISLTIGAFVKVIANFIFVAIPSINVYGAIIGTVLCYVIIVIIDLMAIIHYTKVKIDFISVFVKPIVCGLLCGLGAGMSFAVTNRIIPDFSVSDHSGKAIICIGVGIAVGATVYLISILFVKGMAKDDIIMLPKGEKIAKVLAKYGFIG